MTKVILLFWMVALTITSVSSQNFYPRKLILNQTDTVIVITPVQLQKINLGLNKMRSYEKINLNYAKQLLIADSLNKVLYNTVEAQESVIKLKGDQFEASQDAINALEESMREQQKRNRRTLWGVGAGCTAIGILLGLIL